MKVTLDLTQDEEQRLLWLSSRAGLTPENYLRSSVKVKTRKAAERSLADRMAEVLGEPELGRGGTSNWSEVEAIWT